MTPRPPSPSPTALVLLAVASVQIGSTVAKGLFPSLGPGGAAFLRVAFAAAVLLPVWRPSVRGRPRRDIVLAVAFGLAVAFMNLSFYTALDRIPLGIAVTLEFVGPLGVAVAGSRGTLDLLWALLAACGMLLLTPWGGIHLDGLGVLFALLAGAFWASYILLSARVGRVYSGGRGLAIAMGVGAIALLPIGVAGGGAHLGNLRLLLGGAVVALLSSVIPYSLEIEALRSLSTRVFGVLMSLEPAAGALFGFLVLHQVLGTRALVALVLVSIASLGASQTTAAAPFD